MSGDWRHRAACIGQPPGLFAPLEPGEDHLVDGNERIQAAQAVCARCPVIEDCLLAAMDGREQGVWGGTYLSPGVTQRKRGVDPAAVERCMAGALPAGRLTPPERAEVVRQLSQAGLNDREISHRTGLHDRSVQRIRRAHNIRAARAVAPDHNLEAMA